jgi:hypothetical protein
MRVCVHLPPNLTTLSLHFMDADDLVKLCALTSLKVLEVKESATGPLTTFPESLRNCIMHLPRVTPLVLNMPSCALHVPDFATLSTLNDCCVRKLNLHIDHSRAENFYSLANVFRACKNLTTLSILIKWHFSDEWKQPCEIHLPQNLTTLYFRGSFFRLNLPCFLQHLVLEQLERRPPLTWSAYPNSLRSVSFLKGFDHYPPTRIPDHVQFVSLLGKEIELDLLPNGLSQLQISPSCTTPIPHDKAKDIYRF